MLLFDPETHKAAILIQEGLEPGLAANTSAIIAAMMTARVGDFLGPDIDGVDKIYPGVIAAPLPILVAGADALSALWASADGVATLLPFSTLAQSCKTYDEFIDKMHATPDKDLVFSGLGVVGPRKAVNKITGSFKLFR